MGGRTVGETIQDWLNASLNFQGDGGSSWWNTHSSRPFIPCLLLTLTTVGIVPILERWKLRLREVTYFHQGHIFDGGGRDAKVTPSFNT